MEKQFPRHKLPIALLLAVLIVATSVWHGCSADEHQSPEDVATSFLNDLRRGEREEAMNAIWPPTREALQAADGQLTEVVDGESPKDPVDWLLVTRLESSLLISRIDVDESIPESPDDGQEVSVKIELRDERRAELIVRWGAEDRRWYVDLPVEDRRPIEIDMDLAQDVGDDDDRVDLQDATFDVEVEPASK